MGGALRRARDLADLPTVALTRLVAAGKLEPVSRGVYTLPVMRPYVESLVA
ncbi:MAG: type IV toxin-antitoxin system AbiEi family antitoxin domain-containing protein [Burkholderiaceae bacterium]